LTLNVAALPPYITASAGAVYTWNSTTGALSLTSGSLTFTADSSTDLTDPMVNLTVSGSGASVLFNTTQHLAGLTLTNGAVATVTSTGAFRSPTNHNVLVIGTVNGPAPIFSISSTSKLDLKDNDMVVHNGSLAAVQAAAAEGRNVAPGGALDGTWDGNGLTSSTAAANDAAQGYEQTVLGVALNGDMPASYSAWTVGGFSEPLRADGNDVLVKYTYNGDFALEGFVGADDAEIITLYYDGGASSGNTFAVGDTNGDGKVDANDAAIFDLLYGLGTGGANGVAL
jgi:hypothetical protein